MTPDNDASTKQYPELTVTPAADRVPVSQKIAYGLGSVNDMWGNWLYPSIVWPVFNIFLHVNPALISGALMISRLADAVSDPFFGWISDNTRSRFGRRRPYILIGSILSGLCLPLLFTVPYGWTESQYFIYMVVSSCIFITIVSCFNMPWQSLGAEMTPDYNERTSVYAFRGAVQKAPEVALFFSATFVTLRIFTDSETGEPNSLLGARVYACILGAIMILVGIVIFFTVKERYYEKLVSQQEQKVSIMESLWKALRCRPFRAQLAMSLAYGIGTSMVGTLGYYTTVYYVCGGDVSLGSKWNFGMGLAGLGFGLTGVPVFAFLARRLGKRHTMMIVQIAAIAVFASTWFLYDPEIPVLQLFASGLIAFTGAGFWMLYGSIGADVIDYDELETGKRREGAFAACGTYIMKIGLAIGAGGSGVVLSMTGFLAERGADQAADTLGLMRFYLAAIPITGLLLALFALKRFGLTRERIVQIRAELEARRGEV